MQEGVESWKGNLNSTEVMNWRSIVGVSMSLAHWVLTLTNLEITESKADSDSPSRWRFNY